jgi:hypothetical protein
MSQENYRITDQIYDDENNLTEATIRIYASASDTVNMVNPIATYTLKSFYDDQGRLKDYRVTKN